MLNGTIDIEPTNRCNAWCSFCPRDQTPHQGLMTMETFDRSMEQIRELDALRRERNAKPVEKISLCGLGEPLLNKHLPEMIEKTAAAGYEPHLASNGALLTEKRSEAILDAGLRIASLNVGEIEEAYEEVYQLPWEKTYERVVEFAQRAKGRAAVYIVLVNHNPERLETLKAFWKEHGLGARVYTELNNRGGALELDHMRFHEYPEREEAEEILATFDERPLCAVPFWGTTIGYDGIYYLCCHDWKKEVPLGSVYDTSLAELVEKRMEAVLSRDRVCGTCSHDPANQLTTVLRKVKAGQMTVEEKDEFVRKLGWKWKIARNGTNKVVPGVLAETQQAWEARTPRGSRKLIPVAAE